MTFTVLGVILSIVLLVCGIKCRKSFGRVFVASLFLFDVTLFVIPATGTVVRLPHLSVAIAWVRLLARPEKAEFPKNVTVAAFLLLSWLLFATIGHLMALGTHVIPEGSSVGTLSNLEFDELTLTLSSLTQIMYVVYGILIVLVVSSIMRQSGIGEILAGCKVAFLLLAGSGLAYLMFSAFFDVSAYIEAYAILVSHNPPKVFADTFGILGLAQMPTLAGEPSESGAAFSVLAAVFAFANSLRAKWMWSILCISGALLTGSATGLIALVGLGLLLVVGLIRRRGLAKLSIAAIVSVPLIAVSAARLLDRLAVYQTGHGSGGVRLAVLEHNLQVFASSPFLGVGIGQERSLSLLGGILAWSGIVGTLLFLTAILIAAFGRPHGSKWSGAPIAGAIVYFLAAAASLGAVFLATPLAWGSISLLGTPIREDNPESL